MDDRWDRVILVAGFCPDGEGFIYDFERLLQDFCLSLACLRGKEEEEKKGGGCERGETETCRRVLTAGGWRCEEKIIGILMLWVEALVVNI